jgi:hypothetical protein
VTPARLNPVTGREATCIPLGLEALRQLLPRILPYPWHIVGTDPEGGLAYDSDRLRAIVDAHVEEDGKPWMHLSVSRRDRRVPTWDDLVAVRDLFLGRERLAVQVLPPRSQHYDAGLGTEVLHLWAPLEHYPLPDFLRARGGTL